jgi:hypothetical protein
MARFTPANIDNDLGLGKLIARLEREHPSRVLPLGFANPHSWRGDYSELAFEPVENILIGDVLKAALSALGATFQGYKGGEYTMGEYTACWLDREGESGDNKIGPLLLDLLIARSEP